MPPRVVTLIDRASGATARVLPEVGMNCFSFCPVLDGQPVEMLWAAPGFESGTLRTTSSGTPILFPFAGRLRGTRLRFGDRDVPLVIDEKLHFAIHGFVHNRPWRVIDEQPSGVTAEFHAAQDDAALLPLWPADFRIRVTYEVGYNELHCRIRVDNPDNRPLPFSLGTHGYFRVPLGGRDHSREMITFACSNGHKIAAPKALQGRAGSCPHCGAKFRIPLSPEQQTAAASAEYSHVIVPARRYWELSGMLPTGQKLPADGPRGLAAGMALAEMHLDDVLTDLESRGGRVACRIDDPLNRRRLTLEFDDVFRECVVFNPPHREAVCLEPYTSPPDAFALAERGIGDGPRVLRPGESFEARIDLRAETIAAPK